MSAGDRAAWLRAPGPRAAAERAALRPAAEAFPYLPEPPADVLRRTGRHRRAGRLSAVLAAIRQAARKGRRS